MITKVLLDDDAGVSYDFIARPDQDGTGWWIWRLQPGKPPVRTECFVSSETLDSLGEPVLEKLVDVALEDFRLKLNEDTDLASGA